MTAPRFLRPFIPRSDEVKELEQRPKKRQGWQQAGPGRPFLYGRKFSINVTPEMDAELKAAAKRAGVKVPEQVRVYIQWGLDAEAEERGGTIDWTSTPIPLLKSDEVKR